MYHGPYGPRGAESEQEDFWTDIMEGSDMIPGMIPSEPDVMKARRDAQNRTGTPETTQETEQTEDTETTENREWFEMEEQPDDPDL